MPPSPPPANNCNSRTFRVLWWLSVHHIVLLTIYSTRNPVNFFFPIFVHYFFLSMLLILSYPIRFYLHQSKISPYKKIYLGHWRPIQSAACISRSKWCATRLAKRYWRKFSIELKSLARLCATICAFIIQIWPNRSIIYFVGLPPFACERLCSFFFLPL